MPGVWHDDSRHLDMTDDSDANYHHVGTTRYYD